jgi:hypothetical protein
MTPDQQQIAIADACGWKPDKRGLGWLSPHGYYAPEPDYLNDLNAMHEAEKMLTDKGVNAWWAYVGFINRHNPTLFGSETAVHATASHRAEAFLRTIGKWTTLTKP